MRHNCSMFLNCLNKESEMTLDEVKEMILFCKKQGVTQFKLDGLEFVVLPEQPVYDTPVAPLGETEQLAAFMRGDY
jgi:hypothetical protein